MNSNLNEIMNPLRMDKRMPPAVTRTIKEVLAPYFPEVKLPEISINEILKGYEHLQVLQPSPPPIRPRHHLRQEVHHGDCIDLMTKLPSESVDCVIADPPYRGVLKVAWDNQWAGQDQYLKWCRKWLAESHRILKPSGSLWIWGQIGHSNGWSLPRLARWCEEELDMKVINWITVIRSRGRGWKKGFLQTREELVWLVKDPRHASIKKLYDLNKSVIRTDLGQNGKPRTNKHQRVTDIWNHTTASQFKSQRYHLKSGQRFPCVKDMKSCLRIIEASTQPGGNVLIPFGGSGSEAVAAKYLGRHFVVCERIADHVELIRRNLRTWTPDAIAEHHTF